MRLFDTHCHFETTDEREIASILTRAKAVGVESVVAVGGSAELNAAALCASRADVGVGVWCALGFDRDQCARRFDPSELVSFRENPSFCAVGEIGLDYHYAPETRVQQMKLLADELEFARQNDLPVVIHTREAEDDTVGLLREIASRGVIHCFTGTPREAKKYLDLGFYVSISGIVTFRAADNVRETARYIPYDRILIETDSPFLAPVPKRGSANEPAFVALTCAYLAELRGVEAESFAELTSENGRRAFGL